MEPAKHTRSAFHRLLKHPLSEYLFFAGLFLSAVLFVVDVYAGTFIKPLIAYATGGWILAFSLAAPSLWLRLRVLIRAPHLIFLAYLAAGALSLFLAIHLRLGAEALALECCYFLIFTYASAKLDARRTFTALSILTSIVSTVALGNLLLPSSSSPFEIAAQLGKISTFGNQTYFAGFLALVLPLLVAQIVIRIEEGRNALLQALLAAVSLYLLVITESRSAWGATAIGLVLFFMLMKGMKKISLTGGALAAGVILVMLFLFRAEIMGRLSQLFDVGAQSSVMRRLYFYEGALKAFLASPLIGNGIGNFIVFLPAFRSPEYWMYRSEDIVPHAHNEFLEILSETGIVGLACVALLIAYVLKSLVRSLHTANGAERILIAGLVASITATLLDNLWSMNLRTVPVAFCFWTLMGVALRVRGRGDEPGETPGKRNPAVMLAAAAALAAFMWFLIQVGEKRYLVESRYLEGLLLQTSSREREASEKFASVLSVDRHYADARFYVTANLVQNGVFPEAARNADTLLGEYPYYPKASTLAAIARVELGDSALAIRHLKSELSRSRSPQTLYFASVIEHRLGHQNEEVAYLGELLSANVRGDTRDFGAQALGRMLDIPPERFRREYTLEVLREYRLKFTDDPALCDLVDRNISRISSPPR